MSHKRYEKISFIGEGAFATVYKALDKQTNKEVAIKKIKLGNTQEAQNGVHWTALREIKLLQELNHENVIALLDVFGKDSSISLVFDIMITDLEQILYEQKLVLNMGHIKAYILMTLRGLEYLHKNFILHRDIKPNNLLIDKNNILKLADFGLARTFGTPSRIYTHQVVTRWYKSPELLYGARIYGAGIDIWAAGCVLAELFKRAPLFPGDSDLDTLDRIVRLLGAPTEKNWPGVTQLNDYVEFNDVPEGEPLSELFSAVDEDGLELLESMLKLCPAERCDASQALKMSYFTNAPYPSAPENLPRVKKAKKGGEEEDEEETGLGSQTEDRKGNENVKAEKRAGISGEHMGNGLAPIPKLSVKLEPLSGGADVKPTKAKRLKFD